MAGFIWRNLSIKNTPAGDFCYSVIHQRNAFNVALQFLDMQQSNNCWHTDMKLFVVQVLHLVIGNN